MEGTQERALELLESGANVYLTGKAGTGKTHTINQFIESVRSKGKVAIVVAPTGISAINVGGATIHSTFKVFGFYPEPNVPYKNQKVEWRKVDLLVFDEISMVGPDMIDHVDSILRRERFKNVPFGGIQTVFVGDSKQLPPVYAARTKEETDIVNSMRNKYGSLTFDRSNAFKDFVTVELEEIRRQKDGKLIGLLNRIRNGDFSAISEFQSGNGDEKTVHLMPFNDMVETHNLKELYKLPGTSVTYQGTLIGDFKKEECTVPLSLQLKKGARVIICKNLSEGLVNGDMGTIVDLSADFVTFLSDRTNTIYRLSVSTWDKSVFEGTEQKVIGSYIQMPMKLAYAITVHKSQGLSLDHVCVHVSRGIQPSLLYVALSRCTNYENLFVNAS